MVNNRINCFRPNASCNKNDEKFIIFLLLTSINSYKNILQLIMGKTLQEHSVEACDNNTRVGDYLQFST